MHETGIKIDWVKPFNNTEEGLVCASDMPTHEDLETVAETTFEVDEKVLGATQ